MARFTVLCMKRFREIVVMLEVTLGPDTGKLALRAGVSESDGRRRWSWLDYPTKLDCSRFTWGP